MTEERRGAGAPDAVQPLRLLVIDDDENYRAYLAALGRRLGFWVDTAEDGQAGVDRLTKGRYDVAIIDFEMPRLTGVETIARIRDNASNNTLYAMMLTGHEDVATKLVALNAGFDDFLTKSASEPELIAKVVAARRLASRQRTMDMALRDLYGLATRDDLTGLFNRRFFISESERLLAEGTPLNVMLIDLDGFKQINDSYGHLAGDRVLRDIGTTLHTQTRAEDVVARFGGDEFVIAIPNLAVDAIERIATRVTAAIQNLRWPEPESFEIGASTGIASSHLLAEPTLLRLMNAADRDMYKNKWLRKHPNERPELYEYPGEERNVDELRFTDAPADK